MGTYKYSEQTYRKARKLREDGLGYVSISDLLEVPTSTVRNWVSDIKISEEQISKLQKEAGMNKSVQECASKTSVRDFLHRNRDWKCENCGRREWRGEKIALEMHRTVDKSYDEIGSDEIKLLCPNCHSLTDDWRKH